MMSPMNPLQWLVSAFAFAWSTVKTVLGLPELVLAKIVTYILYSYSTICLTIQHRRLVVLTSRSSGFEAFREEYAEASAELKVRTCECCSPMQRCLAQL